MAVQCNFEGCVSTFDNYKDMKRHKKASPDHVYCYRCDKDFKDDIEKLMHQIQSPKHCCCPLCGIEFKSQSGRTFHIETTHRTAQNLPCAGCKEVFPSASTLMRHVENDECNVITLVEFQQQRAERQIEKDNLAEILGKEVSFLVPENPEPMPSNILTPVQHLPASTAYSSMQEAAEATLNKRQSSFARGSQVSAQSSFLPSMPPTTIGDMIDLTGSEQDFQALSLVDDFTDAAEFNALKSRNPAKPDRAAWIQDFSLTSDLDPEKYKDRVQNRYICPGTNCSGKFESADDFKRHLQGGAHIRQNVLCPSCLKTFRDTTAWVSHAESSRRCRISMSSNYNQVLRETTGGLIGTEGHNEDGSVRYTAPEVTEWSK